MAEPLNYIEYAKHLFYQGAGPGDVKQKLDEAHILQDGTAVSRETARAIFMKLLDDGYAFLPGLRKYVENRQTKDSSFKAPPFNREAMYQYIAEQRSKDAAQMIKENEPWAMRQFAPSFVQGRLQDAYSGKTPGGLKEFGRLASDAVTNYFAVPGQLAFKALDAVDPWHTYASADASNPEGFLRDPGAVAATVASFVQPELLPLTYARLAMNMGKAGQAIKAVKAAQALRGVGLSSDAAKLMRAGRFAGGVGTDAAASYLGSRVNDQTPDYTAGEALAGGVIGMGAQRLLRPTANAAAKGAEDASKAIDRAVAGKEAVDIGLQDVPAVYKLNRAPERPIGQTDDFVRYAMDTRNGLGMAPADLPSGVLSDRVASSPAQRLEQSLVSSDIGEPYARRWANFNDVLNTRATQLTGETSPYETIIKAKMYWPKIRENAMADHFNLSNAFDRHPEIAEAMRAADDQGVAKIRQMFDVDTPEGLEQADAMLRDIIAPKKTLDYIDGRIKELKKTQRYAGGVDALDSPDAAELKILNQLKKTMQPTGVSPLQQLEHLDALRKRIQANLERNPEAKVTPDQAKIFRKIRSKLLDDQETLLGNKEWFGDVVDEAVPLWKEKRQQARIFLDGEDLMEPYLNPRTPNEKEFRGKLASSRAFNENVRAALEQGGPEGAELLRDMQDVALDAALSEEKKTGIPWTSARNRYNRSDVRAALNAIVGPDDPRLVEMDKILELGSRMGSPQEAGSAFGRNANNSYRKKMKMKRMYGAARRMAEADQGIGPKSNWADMEEYLRVAEGEGLPTGEQVPSYVPKETPTLAPEMSIARRAMNTVLEKPAVQGSARAGAGAFGRQAARPGPLLTRDDSEPPEYLSEIDKRLWKETGWRPRPDVGGFIVQ